MRNKYTTIHVMKRDEMFYYVRHIPYDLINIYSVKRLCFSFLYIRYTYFGIKGPEKINAT